MPKKITQNINKDAGLLSLPKVKPAHSKWKTEHSNYLSCNIGDIVPIYIDEVVPSEKRKVTMGMLSHMTTPIAPVFNAQYTEFRSFFIPHRLAADLLAGYKTRKSPFVKVFGEDNVSTSADIVVPLANQKLPKLPGGTSDSILADFATNLEDFGGVADSLDMDVADDNALFKEFNGLAIASYELVYQKAYRNQNRESATESKLYKWCFDLYNRTNASTISYQGADKFHKANREKDYFTGSQPFTLKASGPVELSVTGEAPLVLKDVSGTTGISANSNINVKVHDALTESNRSSVLDGSIINVGTGSLVADMTSISGVSIEQIRILVKTQELLEKDMMYGSDYASSLNAHFGTCPISLVLEEPQELKKVTITSRMQPIFQTSSTSGESTILGTIGANATTQSGEFEIIPETEFKEYGYLMIFAVHKAQNSYDAYYYKPKHIFKTARFDFYTPELNDLGYQPVTRKEFEADAMVSSLDEAISYNEAWAEYRFKFNKVHGMFEPSRNNALDYWSLAVSGYTDIQSLYKQGEDELNRAISVSSSVAPQFYDAYGFVEINDKPMSLRSIPGMDGVI